MSGTQVVEQVNELADKNADSKDSGVRYMAYFSRFRTALRASTRYIAYVCPVHVKFFPLLIFLWTSDVGEAMRPIVPPWVVTSCYGISWLYLTGDVSYETYKVHRQGPSPLEAAYLTEHTRLGLAALQRATFQSIASMLLPAVTIHTAVKQSQKAFIKVKNVRVKTWGPTITGLAIVPVLPYLYDHPVQYVTDRAFQWIKDRLIEQQQSKVKDEL